MRPIAQRIPLGLLLLGTYKLAKSILLLGAGLVILVVPQREVTLDLARLAARLPSCLEHYCVQATSWISSIGPRRVELIGAATFLYGLLYVAQSVGLLLRRRWGGYLVVVTTAFFIPFELGELWQQVTLSTLGILLLNIGIVVYVVDRLRPARVNAHPHASILNES